MLHVKRTRSVSGGLRSNWRSTLCSLLFEYSPFIKCNRTRRSTEGDRIDGETFAKASLQRRTTAFHATVDTDSGFVREHGSSVLCDVMWAPGIAWFLEDLVAVNSSVRDHGSDSSTTSNSSSSSSSSNASEELEAEQAAVLCDADGCSE